MEASSMEACPLFAYVSCVSSESSLASVLDMRLSRPLVDGLGAECVKIEKDKAIANEQNKVNSIS